MKKSFKIIGKNKIKLRNNFEKIKIKNSRNQRLKSEKKLWEKFLKYYMCSKDFISDSKRISMGRFSNFNFFF